MATFPWHVARLVLTGWLVYVISLGCNEYMNFRPASHTAGRAQVLRRLDNVDDKVKAFFAPAATAVLDNSDAHNALAAALAALSGIIEVPKQRRCKPGANPSTLTALLGAHLHT